MEYMPSFEEENNLSESQMQLEEEYQNLMKNEGLIFE